MSYGSAAHKEVDVDVELGDVFASTSTSAIGLTKLNTNKTLRIAFIRKVYTLLFAQLIVTATICIASMQPRAIHALLPLVGPISTAAGITSFVLLLAMMCFKSRHPVNLILLSAWTLAMAGTLATVCVTMAASGDGGVVVQAGGTTLALFAALTAFTFQSKYDFSAIGAGLGLALMGLLVWSFGTMLLGYDGSSMAISVVSGLIFCGYIVYDTHRLIKKMSVDQYVEATIALYLDIVNLFLDILRVLQKMKSRD